MKNIIIPICLIFACKIMYAQPGGGGGLHIHKIYDKNGNEIDKIDHKLTVLFSSLNDTTDYNLPINENHFNYYMSNDSKDSYFIFQDSRITIQYDNDSMVIDFENIIKPNGAGITDYMDSIVFQSGYFHYDFNMSTYIQTYGDSIVNEYKRSEEFKSLYTDAKKIMPKIKRQEIENLVKSVSWYGLTPYVLKILSPLGIIKHHTF